MSEYAEVYRDGTVHVLSERCSTCIFRPGNLMTLQRGRVKGMVEDCKRDQGTIPCHKTIRREDGVRPAVCRGFYDAYADDIVALALAREMGLITEEMPPTHMEGEEE